MLIGFSGARLVREGSGLFRWGPRQERRGEKEKRVCATRTFASVHLLVFLASVRRGLFLKRACAKYVVGTKRVE